MIARKLSAAIAVIGASALLLSAASIAGAATSDYHPTDESRTFATTAGGWTGSDDAEGLCLLQPLLCPGISNSHQSSGGTGGAGDGFLRTTAAGLASVTGNVDGIWTSPAFTYNGVAGATPDQVTFGLDRKASLGGLIQLLGDANYSVTLLNATDSTALTVIDETTQSDTSTWTSIATVSVDPAQLDVGDTYRIRIDSEFSSPVGVLVNSRADYDNIVLRAATAEPGDGDGDGEPDPTDNCPTIANPDQADADSDGVGDACEADTDGDGVVDDVDNCDGVANPAQTDTDGDGIGDACDSTPNGPGPNGGDTTGDAGGTAAVLSGNQLLVPVKCPKKSPSVCKIKTVGLSAGKGSVPATLKGKKKVKPGKKKVVRLTVKAPFLVQLQSQTRMTFRVVSKVRGQKAKRRFRNLPIVRG